MPLQRYDYDMPRSRWSLVIRGGAALSRYGGTRSGGYCFSEGMQNINILYTSGFDGVPYQKVWPDGNYQLHPVPIIFSSPLTGPSFNVRYSRVAFEADLPRIEDADTAFGIKRTCQRHVSGPGQDPNPGKGCVKPPPQLGQTSWNRFSTQSAQNVHS